MNKLVHKYAGLSVPAKYILWAVYGAVAWGGMMMFFSCWDDRAMGHDPWRHFAYALTVCVVLGAAWGALGWRKVQRVIQERIRRAKACPFAQAVAFKSLH